MSADVTQVIWWAFFIRKRLKKGLNPIEVDVNDYHQKNCGSLTEMEFIFLNIASTYLFLLNLYLLKMIYAHCAEDFLVLVLGKIILCA